MWCAKRKYRTIAAKKLQKQAILLKNSLFFVVGVQGLEPWASCSQTVELNFFYFFRCFIAVFALLRTLFATLTSAVSAYSASVCSQTCGQKPLSEHPRDRGQKAVFIVCRSAADGCFVAPVCRIVPLLERLSKSFMQGQAAQNLRRYRQRIPSCICHLEVKLTLHNPHHKIILQPCCL